MKTILLALLVSVTAGNACAGLTISEAMNEISGNYKSEDCKNDLKLNAKIVKKGLHDKLEVTADVTSTDEFYSYRSSSWNLFREECSSSKFIFGTTRDEGLPFITYKCKKGFFQAVGQGAQGVFVWFDFTSAQKQVPAPGFWAKDDINLSLADDGETLTLEYKVEGTEFHGVRVVNLPATANRLIVPIKRARSCTYKKVK